MMIDVGTALVAVIPLLFVKVPQPQESSESSEQSSILANVAEGIHYLRQHRDQMYLVLGATLANFFVVPAFVLLPLFVMQELGGGAYYLSVLHLIIAVGGVVGGSLLASWGGFERQVHTVIVGFAFVGASTLLIGVAPTDSQWMPAMAMFFVGVAAAMINGSIMAILQARVAADYQGRLFTLVGSIAGAITPLSLLLAAPVAELLGIRFWYVAGGACCLLLAAMAAFIPAITGMEDSARDADPA
jgi:DHA3 family macrolide efflux protein-like MFS transporter